MGDRVLVAAEALTDEITGTNNCLQKRIDGARSCVSSLEAYCTETKVKGAAYSNSQQYYTNTYIPLLNQVVYACEELIELNNTILPTFSRYVPSTRGFAADTLVIENEIARLNEENTYFQDQIEYYARAMMPVPPFYYAPDYSGIILWYQGRIWINNYVIGELQKIIEGLQSFNSECAGLFDETDALVSKLNAAVAQLRFASNWNSRANRYIVPSLLADKLSEIEYEKMMNIDGSLNTEFIGDIMASDPASLSQPQYDALAKVIEKIKLPQNEDLLEAFMQCCYINPVLISVPLRDTTGYYTQYTLSPTAQVVIAGYITTWMYSLNESGVDIACPYNEASREAKAYYEHIAKAGILWSLLKSDSVMVQELTFGRNNFSPLKIELSRREELEMADIPENLQEFAKFATGNDEYRPYDYIVTIQATNGVRISPNPRDPNPNTSLCMDPSDNYQQIFVSQMVKGESGRASDYSRYFSESTIKMLMHESAFWSDVASSTAKEMADIVIEKAIPAVAKTIDSIPGLGIVTGLVEASIAEAEYQKDKTAGNEAISFSQYYGAAQDVGLSYLPIFSSDGMVDIPISQLPKASEEGFWEWASNKRGATYLKTAEYTAEEYLAQLKNNTFDPTDAVWEQVGFFEGYAD